MASLPTTPEPAAAAQAAEQASASVPADARGERRVEYHAIFLCLAVVVLVLAATMSVGGGGTQVSLPFLDQPLPELCHTRRWFGIECPGCGMTRCFISLAHGQLRDAWRYNAGGVFLFGLVVLQIPYRGWQLWRIGRALPEWPARPWVNVCAAVLASMVLLQWLVKLYFLVMG